MPCNAAQAVLDILKPWLSAKSDTLHAFSNNAASYEEWLNWELFAALEQAGFACQGRPRYRALDQNSKPNLMGDLLATSPHHHDRYLIEVALVGGGTQSKWRVKINNDRKKLSRLANPSGLGILHKVQLVFLAACNDTQLLQNWDHWLQEIPFYPDSPIHAQCTIALNSAKLPSPGEMTVIAWNID